VPAKTDAPATRPRRRGPSAIAEFISTEALGGIVLLVAVASAIVWVNAAPGSYSTFWSESVTIGVGDLAVTESLAHWVTEGLMTVFFFVVGLEIKRELVRGELRDPRRAALPAIAAVGGMLVPAALFVIVNAGQPTADGWGIPVATDIAFAIAVLAVLGSRIPRPLKLFLLTLAIVDDIGAIIVIALFYSSGVSSEWLLAAVTVVVGIVVMRAAGFTRPLWFVLPGALLWYCCLESGIHPTIAGVVLGLLAPTGEVGGRPVLEQLEHRLHPWSSLVVVPLFALASAGVVLDVDSLRHAAGSTVTWGVVAGLVLGKPLGIYFASRLAVGLRVGRLPSELRWAHVLGAGALAGIGFTVSLFVADLAFRGPWLRDAKLGILAASVTSAVAGWALLLAISRRSASPPRPAPEPVEVRT
jgi:NhaA family Na+:H+ antiporter